jgi:hypothetical protein
LAPRFQSELVPRYRRALIIAAVFLLCCGFCWKLALSNEFTWIDNPDVVHMDLPRLEFQRAAWGNHEFPLWDPHLWCGQPFLGEIVGAAFPVYWPFFWATAGPARHFSISALNWFFVLIHFLTALAAYWLCREAGASTVASMLGGFFYSFCGFVGLIPWPEVLSSLMLAPLVFVFLLRALRTPGPLGNAALAGMFLGLAWLGGHHEVPIYLSAAVAVIWVVYAFRNRRHAAAAGVMVAIAILTSGFQTVPGYEYARRAVRWVGIDHPVQWNEAIPYRIDADNSLTPSSLVDVFVPFMGPHVEAFIGVIALTLAIFAVSLRWRKPWVLLFAALAAGGLLLAFGNWNIIHGVLYAAAPLLGKARNPMRYLALFDLGIAVLVAHGADSLRRELTPASARTAARWLAALGAGILAVGLGTAMIHKPGPLDQAYMTALLALAFAGLVLARERGRIPELAIVLGAFCLMFIELGNGAPAVWFDRAAHGRRDSLLPELTKYADIAEFLRQRPQPIRIAGDVPDALNFGDLEGIDSLTGYGAGVTENLLSLNWPSVRIQNLLGVGYTVTTKPPRPDQEVVFHGASGMNVLKNLGAFPRAWIVYQTKSFPSVKEARAHMDDPAIDLRTTAVFAGAAPALESCADNEEPVVSHTANTVIIEAHLGCRGMLILSDTYYPGWSATVDGRRSAIYEADGALRGVVLDKGAHGIVFRYRPASALIGAVMSLLGVLAACALAWRDGVKTRMARLPESAT